jgi:uncharacterized protein YheU (UPF0270 family)
MHFNTATVGCEVEALGQEVLQDIVQRFIDERTDIGQWNASLEQYKQEMATL